MKQYKDLLQNILANGVEKESGRPNMPNTFGISKADMSFDLQDGFPLLTLKKTPIKSVIHELLWFLRGETNIKYLLDNNVTIWTPDAYRWYVKKLKTHSINPTSSKLYSHLPKNIDEFADAIKKGKAYHKSEAWSFSDIGYELGDLGKVYGYQWRNQNGVDQVADVIKGLKTNPYSRYHIINGWNKADFVEMALPPCHLLYQFIYQPRNGQPYLDLNMYQRSCDTFLGVPFNIASASLLLHIVAQACEMNAGTFNWIGGDTHLYVNHMDQVKECISREPKTLPVISIKKYISSLEDIESLTIDDFDLKGYDDPHPRIKAPLSVGLDENEWDW